MWLLALIAVVILLGYAVECVFYPLGACRKCKGDGKFRTRSGKAWRNCRRCKGGGSRVRVGRRAYNYLRKLSKDAT